MKKVLMTGGCGFIGVNLIDYLQKKQSCQIVVIDNLTLGKKEYLAPYEVEFIEGDIRNQELVNRIMPGINAVIHLAADTRVMDSIRDPDFNFEVNVVGTYNLLKAARSAGVEHFIFASTGGAIIGEAEPPVQEGMVPHPISPYGASKLCGEGYCSAFAGSYGIKTTCLRFSNVYGPRSYHKGSVVAKFYKQIMAGKPLTVYGDGSQTRDFVYVEDLCHAIETALMLEKGGEVYQLGSGQETSVNDLIARMRQVVGGSYTQFGVNYEPARAGEILRTYSDITKARHQLQFNPRVNLAEGLEKTWEWFQAVNKE